MADNSNGGINVSGGGGGWVAIALLIIYFGGKPDLHDLVQALVRQING